MLILHCAPHTVAVAVAIALEEAGLAYEVARLDFSAAEQASAAYLSLNPKGRVPTLETAAGAITETGAILEYIAATSELGLPDTPLRSARLREVMYYIASTMHVNHAHRYRGARWANDQASFDDMRAKVPQTMTASCAFLEQSLSLDPFVGDAISIADPYLFIALYWAKGDDVDLAAFPKLSAFYDMMWARPSVQRMITKGWIT